VAECSRSGLTIHEALTLRARRTGNVTKPDQIVEGTHAESSGLIRLPPQGGVARGVNMSRASGGAAGAISVVGNTNIGVARGLDATKYDRRTEGKRVYEYVVTGMGDFPVDMLHFDQCWPATGDDAAKIVEPASPAEPRSIRMRSHQRPDTDRPDP